MPVVSIRRAVALATAAVTALVLTGAAAPVAADGLGGGKSASDPNEVGVSGTDSALWVLRDPGVPFMSLSGSMVAAPAVVSVPFIINPTVAGIPIYIATGQDNRLWVRSRSQGWQLLAPSAFCIDNPAAVVVKTKPPGNLILTVACHGADHALWFAQELVSPFSLPTPLLGFQSLDGALVNGPAVAAVNPLGTPTVNDELTFFVNGTDGRVWTRTPNSPGWTQQPWRCVGHPAAAAFIAAPPNPPFQVTNFGCQGTDRQLWLAANFGGAWTAASPFGGILVDGPGFAAASAVYAEGTDGALWGFRGGPWTSLGGQVVHGAGAANLLPLINNP